MHTVEITLEQVLLARDRRVLRQRALAARYGGTLLSFTMNIAGPVKDAPLVRLAFQAGLAALDRDLGQPVHRELIQAPTGPEALLVYDRPAPWVKERCLLLEEREAVGRLYDLDVLSPEGEKLSRPQSRPVPDLRRAGDGMLPQPGPRPCRHPGKDPGYPGGLCRRASVRPGPSGPGGRGGPDPQARPGGPAQHRGP